MTTKTEVPKSLVAKLAEAMAEIGEVKPEGQNPHFKYKYYTESQIAGLLRKKLAQRGIMIIPQVRSHEVRENVTKSGSVTFLTTMQVDWLITDGVQDLVGSSIGQGDDPGDKGSNKAFTGALKYFLLKLFLVGGDSDAEQDDATDRRAAGDAPVVSDSDVKGVKRGGHQTNATEAQVTKIRVLARDLELDAEGVAFAVAALIGKTVELPADAEKHGPALVEFLSKLSADELGTLVTKMTEMKTLKMDQANTDVANAEAEAALSDYG